MKTIFVTSFHPLVSRNIVATSFWRFLVPAVRVILIVPEYKKDYFKKTFGSDQVMIEGIPVALTKTDVWFRRLGLAFSRTRTLAIKKKADFYHDRKLFSFLAAFLPAFVFGDIKLCRSFLRMMDNACYRKLRFEALFQKYDPTAIFSTDVQNELDIRLIQEAKWRNLPTIGMIRSWDNLTSKGMLRVIPGHVIVQNEILKSEAIHLSDVPERHVTVIGIPHYDKYLNVLKKLRTTPAFAALLRRNLFKYFDLDPEKRLILFAPMGDRYIEKNETDKFIVSALSELDLSVIVRIPPGDTVNMAGFQSRRAKVVFDETGVNDWRGGRKLNEVGVKDDDRLLYSLAFADVVVTGCSTIVVDAALFDKPVIVAAFDNRDRQYLDSVRRYYDYDHFQPVLQSGGVAVAKNQDELLTQVRNYLARPQEDAQGRHELRHEEVYRTDGHSIERLAKVIQEAIV